MNHKITGWKRLDNAAKIFPPTSTKRNTNVFRFACELYEPVQPEALQAALDQTLSFFPFFQSILRHGLFWYYLEESRETPCVKEEYAPPCKPIYYHNQKKLLFEVTYYHKRINLEVFHALTDGTGALQFLRVLVSNYLIECHYKNSSSPPAIDYDASMTERSDDSFQKYYTHKQKRTKPKQKKAFRLRGTRLPENRTKIIEGVASVRQMLNEAHAYGCTLTEFLAAVYLHAVQATLSQREKNRPVVLTIPVNLRNFFPSLSARNFFSVTNIDYSFPKDLLSFEEIVAITKSGFEKNITKEHLENRLNMLSSLEHNIFARMTPLLFKNLALRAANHYAEKESSIALSNIGKIEMPAEFAKHIRLFDVFISLNKLQMCVCSFEDHLMISFTSPFLSTEIEKNFFRFITGRGISVTLTTNQIDHL